MDTGELLNRFRAARDEARRERWHALDWLPLGLVVQTVVLGTAIGLFDRLVSDIPANQIPFGPTGLEVDLLARQLAAGRLQELIGLPTTLLLTLVGFAVPSLSPALASSLPLLHRQYGRFWVGPRTKVVVWLAFVMLLILWMCELRLDPHRTVWLSPELLAALFLAVVVAIIDQRTNHFFRPLVLSGALAVALLALEFVNAVIPSRLAPGPHTLTLAVIAGLALLDVLFLAMLIVWLLRLREPNQLIADLLASGEDLLRYVARRHTWRGHRRRDPELSDEIDACWEPQHELAQVIRAITEVALRAMQESQPSTVQLALQALARVQNACMALDGRAEWLRIRRVRRVPLPEGETYLWVDRLCLRGLAAILFLSAEEHYASVGREAARLILVIGQLRIPSAQREVLGDLPPELRRAAGASPTLARRGDIVRLVLEVLADAYNECIQDDEAELVDRISFSNRQLVLDVAAAAVAEQYWFDLLDRSLAPLVVTSGRLSVVADRVASLRGLLESVREIRDNPSFRGPVARALIELGAVALASRAYASASILIDVIRRLDPLGTVFPQVAADYIEREAESRSESRPMQATDAYLRIFTVLAASRAAAQGRTRWPEQGRATMRDLTRAIPGGYGRCEVVCDRLTTHVPHAPEELVAWKRELRALCARGSPA